MISNADRFDSDIRHMKRLGHFLSLLDIIGKLLPGRRIQQESKAIILKPHMADLRTILADSLLVAELNEIITCSGQSSRVKKEIQREPVPLSRIQAVQHQSHGHRTKDEAKQENHF